MYNLSRNNYHLKPKSSTIQTPLKVSQFIFELLSPYWSNKRKVLDPCSGMGNLLKPWKDAGYPTRGIDIDKNSAANTKADFLKDKLFHFPQYKQKKRIEDNKTLILCNPPFNGYGKKLGSEVWLDKIIELFGKEIPIVLFAPIGFRLNLTINSNRWKKLNNGDYPVINSIISLPKDIFEGVVFHSEILIFNIKGLEAHYLYDDLSEN